jgi:hypothetical protein
MAPSANCHTSYTRWADVTARRPLITAYRRCHPPFFAPQYQAPHASACRFPSATHVRSHGSTPCVPLLRWVCRGYRPARLVCTLQPLGPPLGGVICFTGPDCSPLPAPRTFLQAPGRLALSGRGFALACTELQAAPPRPGPPPRRRADTGRAVDCGAMRRGSRVDLRRVRDQPAPSTTLHTPAPAPRIYPAPLATASHRMPTSPR